MATDPVPALLALAKERPDPRAVSGWINAYLGKRGPKERAQAIGALRAAFQGLQTAEPRVAGLVLRVIEKIAQ